MNTPETSSIYLQHCRDALASEQAHSLSQTQQWAHVDKPKVHADWDLLYRELAPLIDQQPPDSQQVQSIIERHFAIVSRFYTPTRLAYVGMSLYYAENDDMRNFHQTYHPRMVEFLGEAIPIFANKMT
jgi:hypothetical protein